jgi:hypothetical protein
MNAHLSRLSTRSHERGQTLPLVGVMLVVLLVFAGLAVDVGYWRYSQQIEQSAADSAAIAGANALQAAPGTYATAAKAAATANHFTDDGGVTTTVTANNPPATGPNIANGSAVEVIIQKKQPIFFTNFIPAFPAQWVSVRAVAALVSTAGDCIYVLKNTATTIVNGSTIDAPQCGFIGNGGLIVNGATFDAASIGAAGSITNNGSTYPEATPAPAVPAADPCSTVASCKGLQTNPPATGPCDQTNFLSNGGGTVTLNPGIYCGTTIFNGTSHVDFNPGVYTFTGQVISNGVSDYSGSGVSFNIMSSSGFTFNGSTANLTAPTTGTNAGILFYAPNDTGSAIVNGGSGNVGGMIYFPKAALTFNGSSNSYFTLIAGTLIINGSISEPTAGGGSSVRNGVLVE